VTWLLDAYSDSRTYGSLVYSLLGLPIGIFGFVVVVTGFALGLGLLITLIGIPILVATLLFVQAMAAMERRLAWSLLGASMPRRRPRPTSDGYFWRRLRDLVTGRQIWREAGFLLLRLPLGIVEFTIAAVILGLMFGGFAMPINVALGVESQIGSWTIDTVPESLFYLPISILFLLVGPRILLGWGQVSARIATLFLGVVEPAEMKQAVAETLARAGQADAFAVLDELQLRLGRGPFLTPTNVEATLLAMESSGIVRMDRSGSTITYSLSDGELSKRR
jgi:Putative sensor